MEGWRITLLNEQEKTIFVDADACPVKDEILQTASEYEVQVLLSLHLNIISFPEAMKKMEVC